METGIVFAAALVFIASTAISYLYGRKDGFHSGRESLAKNRIAELEKTVNALIEENTKYAKLDRKVADAIRLLSLNLSYDEVVSEISRLVKEIIPSGFIGLYIYDETTRCLRLSSSVGNVEGTKKVYLLGDGAIGAAAKNKVLISRETGPDLSGDSRSVPGIPLSRSVEMSAPILFNDELLGVLNLRNIGNPDGNEKKVLTMIASLAGMLLRNSMNFDYARQEANTDQLTGLYNRRFFFKRAAEEIVRAKGYAYPLSVFMFDIDNFKHYNDTNGHLAGDNLLKMLSDVIRQITRRTSIAARYGGEEFIVLLPNIDKENAALYAERVRKLTETYPFPFREKQPEGFVSISGGISSFPSDGDSLNVLIELADEALYRAKNTGKNRITTFNETGIKGRDPVRPFITGLEESRAEY